MVLLHCKMRHSVRSGFRPFRRQSSSPRSGSCASRRPHRGLFRCEKERSRLSPRHCERSEAIHSCRMCATMDRFAALAMTAGYSFAILAALIARGLHLRLPSSKSEGAGKTGCALHPRSRVRFAQTKAHTSIQGSGSIPAFPAQWLYGLLRALPGERLFCLRRPREASPLPNLTPAPRRPDHTTSPYARATHVSRSSRVHRISPRVRDDGQRPSSAVRQAELCGLICVTAEAEYFYAKGWTDFD